MTIPTMTIRRKLACHLGPVVQRVAPRSLIEYLQDRWIYSPRKQELNIDTADHPPLFNTVYFEVRTLCNGGCTFCAAALQYNARPDINMPFELYDKVIRELEELDFAGRVAWHVNNDPLVFKDIVRYVAHARKHLPNAFLHILTNGKALNKKNAVGLIEAGLNELSIHWYHDDFSSPLPKIFTEVREEILPRYYQSSEIQKGHGFRSDGGKVFRFNVTRRRETEVLNSRGGSAPNKAETSPAPRGFCEYPFTQFNITVNGDVSQCCSDLFFKEVMGNVKEQHILDIWHSERFTKVREKLIEGDRSALKLCEKCDYYGSKRANSQSSAAKALFHLTQ